jgi:hypothetical protein
VTPRSAKWPTVLLVGWLAVIAAATLTPTGDRGRTLSLCLSCGESGSSGFLLNILLFVPLGAMLARSGTAHTRATLVGLATSGCIEVAQYLVVPGRVTSLGDLLANTLGALLGAVLWTHRNRLLVPRGRVVPVVYITGVVSVLWLGHWSSQPWLPDGVWFLQRTPLRSWSDPHSGELRAVLVDGTDLPSDRIRDASLVQRLRTGRATVDVIERPGPATRRLAYTARLVHAFERSELFAMGRAADALVLHRLTNAARVRLSAPGVRMPGVYEQLVNRTVRWQADLTAGTVTLDVASRTATFVMPTPSVLRGWSALLPRARDVTPWQLHALDLLWGVVLAAPLGWWALVALRQRHRNATRTS